MDNRYLVLVIIASLLALAACRRPSADRLPAETALRFTRALFVDLDARAAHGMLTREDAAARPLSEFEKDEEAKRLVQGQARWDVSLQGWHVQDDEAQAYISILSSGPHGTAPPPVTVTVWLKREDGRWRIWPNYACQARLKPVVDAAEAALKSGDTKTAKAKALEVVSSCPQSQRAVDLLK